jgi:beta-mannan synthase
MPPSSVMRAAWQAVRWSVVVPTLQVAVYVCAAMSLMLFLERLYMAAVITGLWLRRRRNKQRSRRRLADELDDDDLEAGDDDHCCPMVLVQIPMFNEGQVSENCCLIIIASNSDFASIFLIYC